MERCRDIHRAYYDVPPVAEVNTEMFRVWVRLMRMQLNAVDVEGQIVEIVEHLELLVLQRTDACSQNDIRPMVQILVPKTGPQTRNLQDLDRTSSI